MEYYLQTTLITHNKMAWISYKATGKRALQNNFGNTLSKEAH